MRALITNDDGIDSPGLVHLAAAAEAAGLEVLVAAPSWNSSGASASITGVEENGRLMMAPRRLRAARPLDGSDQDGRVHEAYSVDAAPAMIAIAALRGGFGPPPDLVISGINCGRNTGHAILHSGTVGAALTGLHHGACGVAVSIDSDTPEHWETAARVATQAIRWVADERPEAVVNVNVPDVPVGDLRGLRAVPLAQVGAVQTSITDTGQGYFQVCFDPPHPAEPGTDAGELADGWAVITALRPLSEVEEVEVHVLADAWAG